MEDKVKTVPLSKLVESARVCADPAHQNSDWFLIHKEDWYAIEEAVNGHDDEGE